MLFNRSFHNLIKTNNNVVNNCHDYEVLIHYVLKEPETKDTLRHQALWSCAALKNRNQLSCWPSLIICQGLETEKSYELGGLSAPEGWLVASSPGFP